MRGRQQRLAAAAACRVRGRAQRLALAQGDESLAALLARHQVLHLREKAVAARAGEQQLGLRRPGEVVQQLGARLQLDQRGHGLAIAAPAGQAGHGHGVHPAIAAEHNELVDRAALEGAIKPVARLEGKTARLVPVSLARAHPALLRHHHGNGFIEHLDLGHGLFLGLDEGTARVGKLFGVSLDFLDHQTAQRSGVGQNVLQPSLFLAQCRQLLLDLDGLQARKLAQPDFQNVLGLALGQVEARHQRCLGLLGRTDDGNHLVDVEQH